MVTHHPDPEPPPDTVFVPDVVTGLEQARAAAGDGYVSVLGADIARQCLELGLLDEVRVDLVPVVMGRGRPYFGAMGLEDVMLGDPTTSIQGDRVTHLVFPVLR